MAELKDFIPKGNDDENSGDSWFVLSSASDEEDEDDEPETKKPVAVQSKNLNEKTMEKKENDAVGKKPEAQHEKMLVDEKKENGPVGTKIEQPKDIQMEIPEKKENVHIDKQHMDLLETSPKVIAEKGNDSKDKGPKIEQGKFSQENIIGEKLINEQPETPMKQEEIKAQENKLIMLQTIEEKRREEQMGREMERFKLEIEREQKINAAYKIQMAKERMNHKKETMMAEAEKAALVKQKRKPKGLVTDEEGHSEIALEVHALRETLIQLSLNLSSTEEEKYASIASEVQALRETITQLNNDLASRVCQIEARSEQVHTLLCRFIMTSCSNYKEPPTTYNRPVRAYRPKTSHVAVQTETINIKQTPSSVLSDVTVSYKNESKETLPAENLPSSVGKMDETENESKPLSAKPDLPSKEQSESCELKRSKPDDDSGDDSKDSSPKSQEPAKKRRRGRRGQGQRAKQKQSEEPFNQYPTQQTNANQELADLAYRYSTENVDYWKNNSSNHHQDTIPAALDYMDKVIDEWAQDEK